MQIVFGIAAVICAGGWLMAYIRSAILLWYMQEKGCPFPNSDDWKKGSRWVVKHMLKDLGIADRN